MQQQHPPAVSAASTTESGDPTAEAPPKQVALAMERLSVAGRLIADIRLGADRLLEALFVAAAAARPNHHSEKPLHLILKEEASMRRHLEELGAIGRQLESSGVLTGSLRSRGNSWGLHMPLVCPDGAVVAYAWKRQLAGQAGASAVDRTRLALKAFKEQKRRFFPHLDDEHFRQTNDSEGGPVKKQRTSQVSVVSHRDENIETKTLSDFLIHLEREAPIMKVFTYQRLDWLKRATSLLSSGDDNINDPPKEHIYHSSNRLRTGPLGAVAADQVAVLELLVPYVFRAIVSLHPAGSINPDAVAFFSPDEEHANKALQYFLGATPESSLDLLLQWISSYETLFTKACSKCRRILMMDKPSALLLPPVHRPYQHFPAAKTSSSQPLTQRDQSSDTMAVYHIGCSSDET